jgi:hypothetical protein
MSATRACLPASSPARRAAFALIAAFALSFAALAWMLRAEPALDAASPQVVTALVPALLAYLAVGFYCVYLGIAAIRARQFPAPRAHLPVATTIRTGAAGTWIGVLFVIAAVGNAYLAWRLVSLALGS